MRTITRKKADKVMGQPTTGHGYVVAWLDVDHSALSDPLMYASCTAYTEEEYRSFSPKPGQIIFKIED